MKKSLCGLMCMLLLLTGCSIREQLDHWQNIYEENHQQAREERLLRETSDIMTSAETDTLTEPWRIEASSSMERSLDQ